MEEKWMEVDYEFWILNNGSRDLKLVDAFVWD